MIIGKSYLECSFRQLPTTAGLDCLSSRAGLTPVRHPEPSGGEAQLTFGPSGQHLEAWRMLHDRSDASHSQREGLV